TSSPGPGSRSMPTTRSRLMSPNTATRMDATVPPVASRLVLTQIYTAQSVQEAIALAELGVDHVGITVSDRGLPGEIDLATGRDIVTALRGVATSVALTVDTDPLAIQVFAAALEPDILHLCGDTRLLPPAAVADIRAW